MNKYESVIIIEPNLDEEEIDNIIQKVRDIIEENGSVTKVEKMGMKKLAYEIRKNKEGYYIVIYFEADPSIISELERYYRITENIIKFLTVRNDDEKGDDE